MQFSDDRVDAAIKAAAARRRRARERRAELQHARNRGLTARHMAKLARLTRGGTDSVLPALALGRVPSDVTGGVGVPEHGGDTHTTDEPPDAA